MNYVKVVGDKAAIKLRDTLDYNTVYEIIKEIEPIVAQGVQHIHFDCGELQFITDDGVRGLIFIKQKIDEKTVISVSMQKVAKIVKDVLILSGIEGYIDFIN